MFVQNLKVFNIRSFERASLDFSENINLLVGNNNSGKSTILRTLYRLQDDNAWGFEDIRKTQYSGRVIVNFDNVNANDIDLFAVNQGGGERPPKPAPLKVIFNVSLNPILDSGGTERLWINTATPHREDLDGNIRLQNTTYHFNTFKGLPSSEAHGTFIYPFFAKRKMYNYRNQNFGTKESFSISDDLRNISSKIAMLANPSHPQHDRFVSLCKDILGFGVGTVPYAENDSTIGFFVSGNTRISIERMGEGVVNIVGLIVLLLTDDGKLYLIEEPENDIHPKALKKLLHLILEKSESNQFIISTHSNIVVKYLGVAKAKIFQVNWKPFEKLEADRLPTSTITEIENSPSSKLELLESLGYEVFDFDLFKSYIIFEESSAERLVREFLIPEFVPQLNNKIKTIAASGAGDLKARFHSLHTLFVYVHTSQIYHHKAWVFADGDSAGIMAVEELRKKFPTWSTDSFVHFSKPNIELYYPEQFIEKYQHINETCTGNDKRQRKNKLIDEVFEWIVRDRNEAKKHFQTAASEIINYIKKIELIILKNS